MSIFKEFEQFVLRGNVVDMAVGVIIGVSFGKIVTSLVNDVIMPPIGLLLGDVDFSKLAFDLGEPNAEGAKVSLNYGSFINTIIDFVIVAAVIFLMTKLIKSLGEPKPAAKTTTKDCPECLLSIPINAKRCGHCTSSLG